jgi:GNAT superfamily N-acetyltransferase
MSAYRFCRTDDIDLLVDALNRCSEHGSPITAGAFKRSIRDLQVWCSSCMVAFTGSDPIGVLIGAKRSSATLVHTIAVRPDHQRQGHGRHLLASLSSKLAILGPPRIVAEVPDTNVAARGLFAASGYVEDVVLTDFVQAGGQTDRPGVEGRFVIPITLDDLAANGLLEDGPQTCWERSVETLTARKDGIEGLAIATDERIEACVLYIKDGPQILALRSFVEDGGIRLATLLFQLRARAGGPIQFLKVHPAEVTAANLEALGFRAVGRHLLYAVRAGAN